MPHRALNTAIKGLNLHEGHVITTVLEHNSVLRPLYECREAGGSLTIVGCDEKGNIDYDDIEAAVREDTKAIVCTHASNLTGNMIVWPVSAVLLTATDFSLSQMLPDGGRVACRCAERVLTCFALPDIRGFWDLRAQAACMCVPV